MDRKWFANSKKGHEGHPTDMGMERSGTRLFKVHGLLWSKKEPLKELLEVGEVFVMDKNQNEKAGLAKLRIALTQKGQRSAKLWFSYP